MSEIMVRERFLRSGKKVYEYSFEMASVDGKRKRKSKSGFASKRDARIAGRKALSEYENVGQVMVDRDISYADFLDLWMENDCKLTCKESTLYGYEKKIRLYLKPELGGYRVYLKDRINNGNKDFRIVEFDLFHLMIEILQEEGYLEAFFDLEKENGFFEMADSLVETLGLDETNELNLIISRILQEDLTDSVVFLTGVGKCHPIIASHNILNNLHQVLDSVPVVLFYPGEYSGQDLKLFGTMDSHNYYRAFRLV